MCYLSVVIWTEAWERKLARQWIKLYTVHILMGGVHVNQLDAVVPESLSLESYLWATVCPLNAIMQEFYLVDRDHKYRSIETGRWALALGWHNNYVSRCFQHIENWSKFTLPAGKRSLCLDWIWSCKSEVYHTLLSQVGGEMATGDTWSPTSA